MSSEEEGSLGRDDWRGSTLPLDEPVVLGVLFSSMDKRTERGLRPLHIWVSQELRKQLDDARGDVPMQRFVERALEREVRRLEMAKALSLQVEQTALMLGAGDALVERFYGKASFARGDAGLRISVDELAVFNDAASRDAWVAEFPEGRRAI